MGKAISLDENTVVTGHLVGCKIIPAKKKSDGDSIVFFLSGKNGDRIEVWANGVMQANCMNEDRTALRPEIMGSLFRFTGGKKIKLSGKKTMRETTVEMDDANTIKTEPNSGKPYVMKPAKKFKK